MAPEGVLADDEGMPRFPHTKELEMTGFSLPADEQLVADISGQPRWLHRYLLENGVDDAILQSDRVVLPACEGFPGAVVTFGRGDEMTLHFPSDPSLDSSGLTNHADVLDAIFAV